ncbi:hypothetical protein RDI58_005095 [Solanum bulbocastanum]|uniref:Uncharacterized protein n=1 Tax=Solanum bulbocastanum TaxID=147425 RepID=A0AAN8U7L0_SOLBU
MAEKEGAIINKGHEEGLKMALSLMEEFELPLGLLHLADVIEVGYDTEMSGYVEKRRIKNLKGVKGRELMLWLPAYEITVDDPLTGNVQIKSLAGITKTFPAEAFAAGQ